MFARWSQQNFFRYLIQYYDFDKIVSFGTEPVNPEKEMVNPECRKLYHQLKNYKNDLLHGQNLQLQNILPPIWQGKKMKNVW
jgi:hypothetical protein